MSYLLDTNIICEIRKGSGCNQQVAKWSAAIDADDIYLSVLVIGEIRKGIERARLKDATKARAVERWLETVLESFNGHIVPIDRAIAEEWGRMSAKRPVPTVDALLAATAKVRGMTLVTRDLTAITDLGADIIDPFRG